MRVSSANRSPAVTPWRALSSRSSSKVERFGVGGARAAPEQCAQPRLQLAHVERLDEVVVGAGVQAVDPVADRVARGEHEDRHAVAGRAQPPRHLEAVDVRQADVEHHGVRRGRRHLGQRVLAVAGLRASRSRRARGCAAARRAAGGRRPRSGSSSQPIVPGRPRSFGDSYTALMVLLRSPERVASMRLQRQQRQRSLPGRWRSRPPPTASEPRPATAPPRRHATARRRTSRRSSCASTASRKSSASTRTSSRRR